MKGQPETATREARAAIPALKRVSLCSPRLAAPSPHSELDALSVAQRHGCDKFRERPISLSRGARFRGRTADHGAMASRKGRAIAARHLLGPGKRRGSLPFAAASGRLGLTLILPLERNSPTIPAEQPMQECEFQSERRCDLPRLPAFRSVLHAGEHQRHIDSAADFVDVEIP